MTKVDSIGSIIDNDEAGEVGEGDDDANALADHQDLSVLPKLSFVLSRSLCRSIRPEKIYVREYTYRGRKVFCT